MKQQLLASLTNRGRPHIAVRRRQLPNRGELYLEHTYTGVELQLDYARDTLRNLHRLWNRPVHLETVLEDTRDGVFLRWNGTRHRERRAN